MASTDTDRQSEAPSARDPGVEALSAAYRSVADLFVYPEDVDRDRVVAATREETVPAVESHVDPETASLLSSFLEDYREIDTAEYVETLELAPDCPLYLGHYEFDQPETCREIADADRNQYMVELNAIYEHFGFELEDELPDYLPAMVEFLGLTLPDRDDELRDEFAAKTLTLLPGARERFEEHGTPYWKLLRALERLIAYDLSRRDAVPKEVDSPGDRPGSDGAPSGQTADDASATGGDP